MTKMKSKSLSWLIYLGSIILSLFIFVYFFTTISSSGLYEILNSDGLYMSTLYKDIFINGSNLYGWNLITTSLLFPNFIVFSLFNFLTGNFIVAMLLHGFFQYSLFVFLVNYLFKVVNKDVSLYTLALSNLLIALIPLYSIISNDFFLSLLMFMPYHFGAFLMAILTLIWVMRYFEISHSKYLIFIWVLSIVMAFSDRIYFLFFSASTLPVLVYYIFFKEKRRTALILLANILMSAICGFLILRGILLSGYVSFSPSDMFMKDRIVSSFQIMSSQYLSYILENSIKGVAFKLALLSLLILIAYIPYKIIRSWKSSLKFVDHDSFILIYTVVFAIGVWLTPGFNGTYIDNTLIRYNIYVVYLLVAMLPLIVDTLIPKINLNKYLAILTMVVMIVLLITPLKAEYKIVNKLKSIANYYPEDVATIDSVCKVNNLTRGVGEYWAANRTSMFSKNNIKIVSTYGDLNPHVHNANLNWYYDFVNINRGRDFDFVIINKNDSDKISYAREELKSSMYSEIPCGKFVIIKSVKFYFEYNRPYIIRTDRKLIHEYSLNFDTLKKNVTYTYNQSPIIKMAYIGELSGSPTLSGHKSISVSARSQTFVCLYLDSLIAGDDYMVELYQYPYRIPVKIMAYNGRTNYSVENYKPILQDTLGWGKTCTDFKIQHTATRSMQVIIENRSNEQVFIDQIKIKRFQNN